MTPSPNSDDLPRRIPGQLDVEEVIRLAEQEDGEVPKCLGTRIRSDGSGYTPPEQLDGRTVRELVAARLKGQR